MATEQRKDFWQEIKDRRVLQLVGLYLGGSWVALEFTGFIADHYDVSPYVIDLLLLVVAGMLPSVILLAWTHGRPGKDRWTMADKIIVPVNVALTMSLMVLFFGGKELGATTLERTGQDETGASIKRVVPKAAFRKRIGLFFFTNLTGEEPAAWVGRWLPYGLYLDLIQDSYFDNRSPFQMSEMLIEEGAADGMASLALSREIARRYHLEYFLDGAVTARDPFSVNTRLYVTRGGKLVAEHTYSGADLGALVDSMSFDIKLDLDLPAGHIAEAEDLPVAVLSSENVTALENFALGLTESYFRHDWSEATRYLIRSTIADPTFAQAQFFLYQTNLLLGRDADKAIATAMQHLYKVPDRLQGAIKEVYYFYQGEPEKALAALSLDITLFPDDVIAHRRLANFYYRVAQFAEALEEYRVIRELNPDDDLVLRDIASVHAAMGQFAKALEYMRAYSKSNPRDAEVLVEMGDVYRLLGRTDQAARVYERATLLGHNRARMLVKEAELQFQEGHYTEALATAWEAANSAPSPEVKLEALRVLEDQLESLGRTGAAMEVAREAMPLERRLKGPMNGAILHLAHFNKYAQTTMADSALVILQSEQDLDLPDPWDRAAGIILVSYKVNMLGRTISPEEVALVDSFYREYKYPVIPPHELIMARINARRGEFVKAIQGYIATLSHYPRRLMVQTYMAQAYGLVGEGEAALATINQLLPIYPNEPSVLYELYQVQLLLADPAAAETLQRLGEIWSEADEIFLPARQVHRALGQKPSL
ncbi:MAG: tetratricopeptide repeat protein [Candidatus Neomarinimicrobiota bacterium]